MAEVVRVGRGGVCGRDLFVIEVAGPDDVSAVLQLPGPYFACLLACDATAVPTTKVLALARRLLQAGCVYVCCWGPGCERVHDVLDEVDLDLRPDGPITMTTWHSNDSLARALWFFLSCTRPNDAYVDECRAGVGIAIGSADWAAEVRAALSSPEAFCSRVLASGKEPD